MKEKTGNLLERYIDKVVLGVTALLCLWLLISRTVLSPNHVTYDNRAFAPGQIDEYISRQAEQVQAILSSEPKPHAQASQEVVFDINAILVPLDTLPVDIHWPQPQQVLADAASDRKYRLPSVGSVADVQVEHIRAVAYVPTGPLDQDGVYTAINSEPKDIDLVSVEARFDIAALLQAFQESFNGGDLPPDWRDPCLARPVFGAVEVQRQQYGDLGWSDWVPVPRSRIETRSKMFAIPPKASMLSPGGIGVLLQRFSPAMIQADLLQPESYRIASAGEDWLPPSFHKEFVAIQRQMELQERRRAIEAEREQRKLELEKARAARGSAGGRSQMGGREGGGGVYGRDTLRDRRVEMERDKDETTSLKPERTIADVYKDFQDIRITSAESFAAMTERLVLWAHDDTVQPGLNYRYRIRLGVLNPLCGTGQLVEGQSDLDEAVFLWTDFSDATAIVDIPKRLYFFPTGVQEASEAVSVEVFRYAMGYWYGAKFSVMPGESIGGVEPYQATDEAKDVLVPETIDYSTDAVYTGIIPVNDWAGGSSLRPRHYFDMLYSYDGTEILRIAIKSRYWSDSLRAAYTEISRLQNEPREPLRPWTGGRDRITPRRDFIMPEEDMFEGGPTRGRE